MADATVDTPGGATPAAGLPVPPAATPKAAPPFNLDAFLGRAGESLKRGDLGFAMGLTLIMVVLIMPLPPWLLDIGLAMSITLAVLIMMTIVFIKKALEFNSFPVVLLIATL